VVVGKEIGLKKPEGGKMHHANVAGEKRKEKAHKQKKLGWKNNYVILR